MHMRALLAISATLLAGAGAASAGPGAAVRDVVGGTTHRVVQTGRAGVHEGERVGHRVIQTGRATGHAVAKGVRRATGHRRHHYRRSHA